ncbi:MAG: hypothetical protein Q7K44_05495, partial [Candidatus Liptonbacteria bacterium]|nr:hypothetical protein [Candidatus Liptonbacteria bacterium]
EYFANDVLHTLPASVKSMWPRSYVRAIENFERSASVRKRMRSVLRRLGETQSILITHDALCGFMVKAFTRGVQNEIAKGDFLVLEGNSEHLVVKAVGDNRNGDSETNIFDLV